MVRLSTEQNQLRLMPMAISDLLKKEMLFMLLSCSENNLQLPQNLQFSFPKKFKKISVLGSNKAVKFEQKGNDISIQTSDIKQQAHAVVFKME